MARRLQLQRSRLVDAPIEHTSAPSNPASQCDAKSQPDCCRVAPAAAAAPEQALAALAAAILGGPHRQQLSKDRRALLHLRCATLMRHMPAQSPTRFPAQAAGQARRAIARAVARTCLPGRESCRCWTATASSPEEPGSDALLWGSLAVARRASLRRSAPVNPPGHARSPCRKPVEVLSEVAAVQELVRQLHAMVYGYQLAIGKMKLLSKPRTRAERELLATRVFRDRLIAWLRKRSAEVPAAEPAYVPSVVPRNAATSGRLIMRMQTALQPFCGLWLAAALQPGRPHDRR